MEPIIIVTTHTDNVGIVANPEGLIKGTWLPNGNHLVQNIPFGHKVALADIGEKEPIIRYGQTIGYAHVAIGRGEGIGETNMSLPDAPELDSIPLQEVPRAEMVPLAGYTFEGYRNSDGSVGTRNILGITTSVQCVAGFLEVVFRKIRQELLPKYPNVDEVVALNHAYGCGVAIDAPAAVIPIRTIRNITTNPNFGGEVLIVGLGCEKLRPEALLPFHINPATAGKAEEDFNLFILQDESFHGFHEMVEAIMVMAEKQLMKLDQRRRETCPASDLVVGMQCGGSDAFSGLTCNPAAGFAADLLVRAGGSVLFSEVTEVRDAIHLLVPRAINVTVGKALLDQMKWYDAYLELGEVDRSANTAPGNKSGGLSNIVEKAMGSIAKSGTTPIIDVLAPGEKIRSKGLTFAATPASDFVCGTLQLAAGMNLHVFMTGRGTPYGLSMVPVIKVGSNSRLSNRWFDLIDLDAGLIATGEKSIEEVGWELIT